MVGGLDRTLAGEGFLVIFREAMTLIDLRRRCVYWKNQVAGSRRLEGGGKRYLAVLQSTRYREREDERCPKIKVTLADQRTSSPPASFRPPLASACCAT